MAKRKTIPQLPVDIIINILSSLPVKSLLRFKCVCKQWRSLISDPQFAKLHLSQTSQKDSNINSHRLLLSTKPFLSIHYEAYNSIEDSHKAIIELDFPAAIEKDPGCGVHLLGSCNGLVCLVVDNKEFILWNPCTRQSRQLPKPKPEHLSNGWFSYGLGYDFSNDDYKLLKVSIPTLCYPAVVPDKGKVEVLSMKSNVWRRLLDPKPDMYLFNSHGIFLNGWLHWLGKNVSGVHGILSFDLAEEKFQVVPLPNQLEADHYRYAVVKGLVLSGDYLCLFIECDENIYEGWEMKEFGVKSSWIRLFNFQVDPMADYYNFFTLLNVLCYSKSGKVIINYDGFRVDMFDPNEKRFEHVPIYRNNYRGWLEWITYRESLLSPNFSDV